MRTRIIAAIAAFSLLFGAGAASANRDETDPRADTLFTFGYDPQAQLFFSSTHANDSSPLDCTLTGELAATYEKGTDGVVLITDLMDEDSTVILDATNHALAEGVAPAVGSVPYADATDECGISGISVGSQGHINHGQFMKLFNATIDMRGRGCLNRWLAQSSLGKDDQQVKHQDFEAVVDIGTEGTIVFTSAPARCNHGKQDKNDADAAGIDHGRGHRPDKPGKADQAPGRNKDK